MEEGGKPEVGGFEGSLRRGWNSVLHVPSCGGGFGQRTAYCWQTYHAVRGFGGARARRLADRVGGRSDTASQLVGSPLLWSMGVSGRLP